MKATTLYSLAELVSPRKAAYRYFRSVDGLYNQKYKYPPERIISHSFYIQNPEEFYRFYKDRMLFPDAKPNAAHKPLQNWNRKEIKGCDYPEH